MRRHTEIEETNTVAVEEDVCSTQNMIQDARARKRGNIHQQCDICEYSTASKAMLRVHRRTTHRKQVEQSLETEKVPITNSDNTENENKEKESKKTSKYIRKRKKCEQCDKQFNKESNLIAHMKSVHVGKDTEEGTSNIIVNNTIELKQVQEMTSHYHLRRPRVTEKQ